MKILVEWSIFTGMQFTPKNISNTIIKLLINLKKLKLKYLMPKKLKTRTTILKKSTLRGWIDKTLLCKHRDFMRSQNWFMRRNWCNLMLLCLRNIPYCTPLIHPQALFLLMLRREYLNTRNFLTVKPQFLNLHRMTLKKNFPWSKKSKGFLRGASFFLKESCTFKM